MQEQAQLNTDQYKLINRIKRGGIASIILGAGLVLVSLWIRGVMEVVFTSIETSIPAYIKIVIWLMLLASISLIVLGLKIRKINLQKVKTYLVASAFISWIIFLAYFFSGAALADIGINTGLTLFGLLAWLIVPCLVFIHLGLKAVNDIVKTQNL